MDSTQAQKIFKAGDVIMRQGEKGECAYIIEDGQVEILIEGPGGSEQQVGTRGAGTIIGEMAIVDEAPRTATVKALKDCKMLEISKDNFLKRLKSSDPVIQVVSQVILARYRDMITRAEILGQSDSITSVEATERTYTEQSDMLESVRIANELKAAIKNNDLQLYYQPIVNLALGKVVGFEALMRWHHAEYGFISPGLFIPIAEKSGLIVDASQWALKEGCAALSRISKACGRENDLYMSVNFSSHDFASESFVKSITDTVENAGVKPENLTLEITERLLIQQPDNAKDALQKCRDAGMNVAIDDFGTGYSSLSYLYYFPINILKIDQSFVRAMRREAKSLELVKSIVGLGSNMGMSIIAEGVEELEEGKILKNLGCHYAQGYYFSHPMPEDQVIEALQHWKNFDLSA